MDWRTRPCDIYTIVFLGCSRRLWCGFYLSKAVFLTAAQELNPETVT